MRVRLMEIENNRKTHYAVLLKGVVWRRHFTVTGYHDALHDVSFLRRSYNPKDVEIRKITTHTVIEQIIV